MGWREGAGELDARMLERPLPSDAVQKLGAWLAGDGAPYADGTGARRSLHPGVLGRHPAVALGVG